MTAVSMYDYETRDAMGCVHSTAVDMYRNRCMDYYESTMKAHRVHCRLAVGNGVLAPAFTVVFLPRSPRERRSGKLSARAALEANYPPL